KLDQLTRDAFERIGVGRPDCQCDPNCDANIIAAKLREADLLHQIASAFDASIPEMVAWRSTFNSGGSSLRSAFETLAELRTVVDANRAAQRTFTEDALRFLAEADSSSHVSEWLRDLDSLELACIIRTL